MSFLTLPTLTSVLLAIAASAVLSILLYYVIHPLWAGDVTEETKKTADHVSVRIGVVYAVVIGMMFAEVRIEHAQMIQAIESEASALTRLYALIDREPVEDDVGEVRDNLLAYIQFIVEEQWPALREARPQPADRNITGRAKLDPIWDYVLQKEQRTGDPKFRVLLDQVEHFKLMRLFDAKGSVLPLFWYIAFFGYLASLVPLYVHPPNLRRCSVIALYSGLVSVVLLAIFILSNPYSTAAGIEPIAYKSLLEAAEAQ